MKGLVVMVLGVCGATAAIYFAIQQVVRNVRRRKRRERHRHHEEQL